MYVKQGLEAVLPCKYEDHSLSWSVNVKDSWRLIASGDAVVNITKYKVSINRITGLYYRLHVLNTQPDDEVIYRCTGGFNKNNDNQLNLYSKHSVSFSYS